MAQLPFDATAFLILFARVGAVLMLLPVFSEDAVTGRIRLLMGLGFTAGLFGLLNGKVTPVLQSDAALPGIVIAEMMVGLAMGMIIRILFSAAVMAGGIISLQVGLSSALFMDPAGGGHTTQIGKLMSIAAAIMCMAMGVHHLWIASIVHSYTLFPVGGLPPADDFARLAVETTTHAMLLALGMAAPLIVYGIVFNVALGLAARMAPAIQVFFISQPLNILLGLALLSVVIGGSLMYFTEAMGTFIQRGWSL
ncbi:flagellar biosynthetic protein FliR [Sphingomonas sp. C3-2]|uniref:flagellar biosynthetic protein FliR n=1 Tax=Sphingomonas sp. C3-2 TaxID=3062169 RepID=UPI00294B4487|nr:flagellar biosynthetic protein FliR [Sphingomonas sp. C3-2]WOK37720.1 flagellar biosynthetic protein FliR [Sphingomonas sp. C3-2]